MTHKFLLLSLHLFFISFSILAQPKDFLSDSSRFNNVIFNDATLQPLFNKLRSIKTNQQQVTILQMGDSHMQMGYFPEEIRTQMGKVFGLSSVGNIFPYPVAKYRPFYIQTNIKKGKWEGNNYLSSETDMKYGVAGFTIKTNDTDAILDIIPKNYPSEIATGNQVVIFFEGDSASSLQLTAKNTLIDSNQIFRPIDFKFTTIESSKNTCKKGVFMFEKSVNQLSVQVKQHKQNASFYIYDVQLLQKEKPGVIYHNFGVGGAQFSNLCKNASYSISQMKEMKPDLIIFSYGSNESYTPAFRYRTYCDMVSAFIDQIQVAIPTTTIILTSPPDTRSKNRYPRNSDSIGIAFKNIAIEKNIAYWDLRSQMGGDGSLYKWLKLGLSSSDQLHFTREGYKLQAKLFMEAFYRSFNKYVGEKEKVDLPEISWPKQTR